MGSRVLIRRLCDLVFEISGWSAKVLHLCHLERVEVRLVVRFDIQFQLLFLNLLPRSSSTSFRLHLLPEWPESWSGTAAATTTELRGCVKQRVNKKAAAAAAATAQKTAHEKK